MGEKHKISGFEASHGLQNEKHNWEQDCDGQAYH